MKFNVIFSCFQNRVHVLMLPNMLQPGRICKLDLKLLSNLSSLETALTFSPATPVLHVSYGFVFR